MKVPQFSAAHSRLLVVAALDGGGSTERVGQLSSALSRNITNMIAQTIESQLEILRRISQFVFLLTNAPLNSSKLDQAQLH